MNDKKPRCIILVGLGFGDEGKGSFTDFFCRTEDMNLVVRYNGGSNAGHNVVTDDGRHHCFSQIGSGAFAGAATLLSKYCMVDPVALASEASILAPKLARPPLELHYIDRRAPIITPFHVAANRIREFMRGAGCHGSTGKGIGELAQDIHEGQRDVLAAGDLFNPAVLEHSLTSIWHRKRVGLCLDESRLPKYLHAWARLLREPDEPRKVAKVFLDLGQLLNIVNEDFVNRLIRDSRVAFEGAQGTLLDQWHGFHPHTTWSDTTQSNALAIIDEADCHSMVEILGVIRAYHTRHGAGPFPSELPKMRKLYPWEHNDTNHYQHDFRIGLFDVVMAQYAAGIVNSRLPMTGICLTHLDVVKHNNAVNIVDAYQLPADECIRNLKVQKDRNNQTLIHQEELGKRLRYATPLLTKTMFDPNGMISVVEASCLTHVRYTSWGPRPSQKEFRPCKAHA